jgi:hypothetical protein
MQNLRGEAVMPDLNRALVDISRIREQLARGSEFHGYGPATVGATGVLALLAAAVQAAWVHDPAAQLVRYLQLWGITAAASFSFIVLEAIFRSRREHGGLALTMLQSALEQFLPAIVAGGLLTVILPAAAPSSAWLLPGLWLIIFSLGVFASCRLLPRAIFIVGVWYLFWGLASLALLGPERALSPWAMGIPFGVGQLLVAGILLSNRQEEKLSAQL